MKDIKNNSKYIKQSFKEYLSLKKTEKSNPDIKVDTLKAIIDKMAQGTSDHSSEDLKTQYEETFEQLCKESGANLLDQIKGRRNDKKLKSAKRKMKRSCVIEPKVSLHA